MLREFVANRFIQKIVKELQAKVGSKIGMKSILNDNHV